VARFNFILGFRPQSSIILSLFTTSGDIWNGWRI
jgi:hypothetical protein